MAFTLPLSFAWSRDATSSEDSFAVRKGRRVPPRSVVLGQAGAGASSSSPSARAWALRARARPSAGKIASARRRLTANRTAAQANPVV